MEVLKIIWEFAHKKVPAELKPLTQEEYYARFQDEDDDKLTKAFEKAWEIRNFEIELYWKRAAYFWTLQIASFTAYFAILNSKSIEGEHQSLYIVSCIGFITSLGWAFINIGNKIWQRHWEIHIDLLEDRITGPLYKTVTTNRTYSVSKINEIISRFIVCIWVLFVFKYLISHITLLAGSWTDIDWTVIFSTLITIYFAASMHWGHGRGNFSKRELNLFARSYSINPPNNKPNREQK